MDDIKINIASFEAGNELKRSVLAVVQRSGFKLEDLVSDNNLDKALNLALLVDGDKDVYNALWDCLIKCTYKGEKITKASFDLPEMREQYFPIIAKCIETNLSPFISGLRSVLGMFHNPEAVQEALK